MTGNERNAQIVATTLAQLGGRRFLAMTGAKCVRRERTLVIKLPRGTTRNQCTHCEIELTPCDLYAVTFDRRWMRNGRFGMNVVSAFAGIYCDKLVEVFERETGLYTRL